MPPFFRKSTRFPFFSLPEPKFLTRRLKVIDDFVVLMRVTLDISIFNYINLIINLIYFILASLCIICSLLAYTFSKAPILLFTFLIHNGWMMAASLFGGYTIPDRLQLYPIAFWFTLGLIAATFWICSRARRYWADFIGLLKMHRMTEEQRKDFALQRFLQVNVPLWLIYSANYEPTAEELLALFREREQATEQQIQAIAATLEEDTEATSEQNEQPSMSMLLTLTSTLTLSIIAPDDKRATFRFGHAVVPLIGFLATREKGAWTTKEELDHTFYSTKSSNAFAMQRQRAEKRIVKKARAAGILPQQEAATQLSEKSQLPQQLLLEEDDYDDDDTDESDMDIVQEQFPIEKAETGKKSEIEFFKNQIQDQISSWQLISDCNVEVFPFLTDFYQKVAAAQALSPREASSLLSLEQLHQSCHHVIKEYKEGFLSFHMKKGYIWPWALPLYHHYQGLCLVVLKYTNERERERLQACQTRKEKAKSMNHIARLYGWQALVGASREPQNSSDESEHDMVQCLKCYASSNKTSAAHAAYWHYCELRSRNNRVYEPGEELKKCAEGLFPSE